MTAAYCPNCRGIKQLTHFVYSSGLYYCKVCLECAHRLSERGYDLEQDNDLTIDNTVTD